MSNFDLRQFVLSEDNIAFAIHTVESYIQNKALLEDDDKILLSKLKDIYNAKQISEVINSVRKKLVHILDDKTYFFSASVYFKPKKCSNEDGNLKLEYRPIHMTDLISQISIIALLHVLIYKFDNNMKLSLSELSQLIPENFYGNKISVNGNSLFKHWTKQYSKYNTLVNELIKECKETNEYKYIVTLDLKNFFPSVSHEIMYDYLVKNIPVYFDKSNRLLFKKIIKKLVYIKIKNYSKLNDFEKEQYTSIRGEHEAITWCVGIPQGLPHSYIFANFIMIKVSEIYKSFFKGPMYFYVDDSAIFTNKKLKDDCINIIEEINDKLNSQLNNLDNIKLCKGIIKNDSDKIIKYGIHVHEDDKSDYEEIENMRIDYAALARETSKVSFDMYSTFGDDEIQALYDRYIMILNKVEKELIEINNEKGSVQLKKLTRYKKFYKYRILILESILEKDFDKAINIINEHIYIGLISSDILYIYQYFFEIYSDDAVIAILNYILKNIPLNKQEKSIKLIEKIIQYLCATKINKNNLTIYKEFGLENILNNKNNIIYPVNQIDKYFTLDRIMRSTFKVLNDNTWKNKLSFIKDELVPVIHKDVSNNFQTMEIYNFINHIEIRTYSRIIDVNDKNIYRYILNTFFSYLFNIPTSDRFIFNKNEHRLISYFELRILSIVRNKKTSINRFLEFINRLIKDNEQESIDYLLLEVMDRFRLFVSNPDQIDNLILIHKFCSDTWKNGSKYLNFYTMHNQEHAVSLIKNVNTITKKISELQVNQNEAFILFASCYLHDISMVTVPNLLDIVKDKESKNSLTEHYRILNRDSQHGEKSRHRKKRIKQLIFRVKNIKNNNYKINKLIKIHNRVYDIIANYVRRTHPETSAIEISKHRELNFLSNECRQLIAKISLSHGDEVYNIYGFNIENRSQEGEIQYINNGNENKVQNKEIHLIYDEQKLKIMLRIADLLDINRYRISKVVFNHNLDKFDGITKFHWISHLLTEDSDINVSYINNENVTDKFKENIDFIVYVNFNQKTKIESKCKYYKYISDIFLSENEIRYSFQENNANKCENKCNILCYWFTLKNNYLVQEIAYLQKYLNQHNVFYDTSLNIMVKYTENSSVADSNILSHLIEYVKNESIKNKQDNK